MSIDSSKKLKLATESAECIREHQQDQRLRSSPKVHTLSCTAHKNQLDCLAATLTTTDDGSESRMQCTLVSLYIVYTAFQPRHPRKSQSVLLSTQTGRVVDITRSNTASRDSRVFSVQSSQLYQASTAQYIARSWFCDTLGAPSLQKNPRATSCSV
jgi:hypothetical protein